MEKSVIVHPNSVLFVKFLLSCEKDFASEAPIPTPVSHPEIHPIPSNPFQLQFQHGATSVFDVFFAQDSPHQEPRVLSKQMRAIDENEKKTRTEENFQLADADFGTGPGPVSSISGPKVIFSNSLFASVNYL